MTEWRECKLRELADFNPDSLAANNKLQFISYLDTGSITKGKINTVQHLNLSVDKVPSRAKRIVNKNDIVYSTVRPNQEHYGIIKNPVDNMIVSTGFTVIRSKEDKCYSDFLYYFLTLPENTGYLSNVAEDSTTAYPSITPNVIMDMDIFLPPLPEQEAIAEVLSSLDDKIDLLMRQNTTLETLAQTYFRQWFVEGANEDWEEKGLDEIADFLNGLPLQKYPYKYGEPVYAIKIKELNSGYSDNSDICSADVPEKYIVNPGDIVFSWSGSLVVDIWKYGKGALNQHLFKVTSDKYPKWFYYYWIKYHLPEFRIIAESKATTMGHIQRGHLTAAKVLVPSDCELTVMDKTMQPLIEKIEQNNAQILTLQKLRDTLLPKLISGEVRVKQ